MCVCVCLCPSSFDVFKRVKKNLACFKFSYTHYSLNSVSVDHCMRTHFFLYLKKINDISLFTNRNFGQTLRFIVEIIVPTE